MMQINDPLIVRDCHCQWRTFIRTTSLLQRGSRLRALVRMYPDTRILWNQSRFCTRTPAATDEGACFHRLSQGHLRPPSKAMAFQFIGPPQKTASAHLCYDCSVRRFVHRAGFVVSMLRFWLRDMMRIKPVILSGGSGTRHSAGNLPKQFIDFPVIGSLFHERSHGPAGSVMPHAHSSFPASSTGFSVIRPLKMRALQPSSSLRRPAATRRRRFISQPLQAGRRTFFWSCRPTTGSRMRTPSQTW